MSASELWSATWPWLWPTALLAAWIAVSLVGVRRLLRWLERRSTGSSTLSERFVRRARQVLVGAAVAVGVVLWGIVVPTSDAVTRFLVRDVQPWLWPTVALAVWLVGMHAATRRAIAWLEQRTQRTTNQLDDAFTTALARPLSWLVALVGVAVWADLVPLPAGATSYVELGSKAVAVLVLIIFADGFVQAWMTRRAMHSKVLATSGGVLRSGARLLIWVLGLLMIISTMGIDITPILASLGLGSLAIGLALKNTLEDFFAGLLLAADQAIRVGDFVDIESGQGGWVLSIGWRTTRLRTRDDIHVIVPNSKLSQSTLFNRSLPQSEVSFTVDVGVHYASDLDHVARVAREVAKDVITTSPKAVAQFEPRVVYGEFGDSSINFRVWLRARSWDDHFGLRDAFIRALHPRFQAEGIVIPFPIRTLDVPAGTRVQIERVETRPEGASSSDRPRAEASAPPTNGGGVG